MLAQSTFSEKITQFEQFAKTALTDINDYARCSLRILDPIPILSRGEMGLGLRIF